jgi:hypothetical protein
MSKTPADKGTRAEGSGSKSPAGRHGRHTSLSPAPRRGRSLLRGGEIVVRERVVRENSGSANYPTLTRSNYAEWAMVMRV